ncbi:MAG: ABC transporter permease [Anaerolineae bacterium]|nr:ABC transporter permease [Anaerolineae bacterium]
MLPYILKRLLSAGLILLVLSGVTYLLIYGAPADPAQVIASQRLGRPAKAEDIHFIRIEYGLDRPIYEQYLRWLGDILRGDLGYSIRTGRLILGELRERISSSLMLASTAMGLSLVLGTIGGVWSALRPNSLIDSATRLLSLLGVSIPDFWLAFVLIMVFAVYLRWLPSFGAKSASSFVLPTATLAVGYAARLSQLIRSILLDTLSQDYIRTAQAKGLSRAAQVLHHAFPPAAAPFVTIVAYQYGSLVSSTIIVETVFSWPGLGTYYITAVNHRDLPVIQVMVLVYGAIFIASNLLADLICTVLDPRLR